MYDRVRILDEQGRPTGETATFVGWHDIDHHGEQLWELRLDPNHELVHLTAGRFEKLP